MDDLLREFLTETSEIVECAGERFPVPQLSVIELVGVARLLRSAQDLAA